MGDRSHVSAGETVTIAEDHTSGLPVGLRRIPRQQRSRDRVDDVLRALLDLVRERSDPGAITTTDVAERAGLPVSSLYVYFEDLKSIVDAAVVRMLERHDAYVMQALDEAPQSVEDIVDRVFDAYARLYREEAGFVALRGTSLFEPHHVTWLRERVLAFVRQTAESLETWGVRDNVIDLTGRVDLVFAIGDTVLLHAYRDDPTGDPASLQQGREILQFALRRLTS